MCSVLIFKSQSTGSLLQAKDPWTDGSYCKETSKPKYLHEDYINNMTHNAFFPADNADAVASKTLSKFTEEYYQRSFVISICLLVSIKTLTPIREEGTPHLSLERCFLRVLPMSPRTRIGRALFDCKDSQQHWERWTGVTGKVHEVTSKHQNTSLLHHLARYFVGILSPFQINLTSLLKSPQLLYFINSVVFQVCPTHLLTSCGLNAKQLKQKRMTSINLKQRKLASTKHYNSKNRLLLAIPDTVGM